MSRVGSAAQTKAIKKVSGTTKLDLAQFRELQAFAQFGSDLDKATQAQLNRGERLDELLKQDQYSPLTVAHQVLLIYAATQGVLDDIAVSDCRRFESGLYEWVDTSRAELLKKIVDEGKLDDELKAELDSALSEYKKQFVAATAA